MRGGYGVSLADIAAIQDIPTEWVWAWLDGAKRRREEELRYRADVLAAIMTAGGIPVNPRDLYPKHGDIDEQIRRMM